MEIVWYLDPPAAVGILLFLFVLGSCIFSFLNVVIYRVPRKLSVVKGRSFCPDCGHALAARDLVPVLSRAVQGGKCRYCKGNIDIRYTLVEVLGGVLACLSFVVYGFQMKTVLVYLFLAVCTVISFVDWDTMEIPNGFLAAMILVGAGFAVFFPEITPGGRLVGMAVISVPMLLLTTVLPGAFGGGDIKLTAVAGLVLGWKLNLLAFFLAVLAGGGYGIFLLVSRKKGRKERFAFGPFLCGGMGAALLWGADFISWYGHLLGF